MKGTDTIVLRFDETLNKVGNKKLSDGLSAVVRTGNTLWIANDESNTIERLTQLKNNDEIYYGEHAQFAIDDFIKLPLPSKDEDGKIAEIDIEGLDYKDGYLWLIGSHSLKRKKPDDNKPDEKKVKQLARVSSDGNRFLLARIPLKEKDGLLVPVKESTINGRRLTAGKLRGSAGSNELVESLAADEHLKDFFKIPGKDNGFDIEGLAVDHNRIFIGLRGPVLRGYAVILEVQVEADDNDQRILKLAAFNDDNKMYRKYFLDLGGLGIREISIDENDMLILAGPTMFLDGPVTIFRWENYAIQRQSFVCADTLKEVKHIPFGKGEDHAEGMTRFSKKDGKATALLLVNDSASDQLKKGSNILGATVFELNA
jgi:hypothetical protein